MPGLLFISILTISFLTLGTTRSSGQKTLKIDSALAANSQSMPVRLKWGKYTFGPYRLRKLRSRWNERTLSRSVFSGDMSLWKDKRSFVIVRDRPDSMLINMAVMHIIEDLEFRNSQGLKLQNGEMEIGHYSEDIGLIRSTLVAAMRAPGDSVLWKLTVVERDVRGLDDDDGGLDEGESGLFVRLKAPDIDPDALFARHTFEGSVTNGEIIFEIRETFDIPEGDGKGIWALMNMSRYYTLYDQGSAIAAVQVMPEKNAAVYLSGDLRPDLQLVLASAIHVLLRYHKRGMFALYTINPQDCGVR